MAEETRIGKYLWAIRVFKTRSEATDACKGGKIKINGADAKPSKAVRPGDTISARKGAVTYTYKVIEAIEKRQGAKLVSQYAENITPQSELDKLKSPVETFFLKRDRGTGRPTKKERRQMDSLWDSLSFDVPDDVADRFASEYGFDDNDEDDDDGSFLP
ncbi:MAG: RNA-binding S4 domain-containing protein [Bacteroidetes bacterium]|uniref:RNA-binding S4 domain-containing protein n=1 Tax=Candidatus Cryptobacteroides merdavium TaxID=2840769 RepID=A0A9D9EHY0_9BACT|nr:RNA-binding S4 domain-containing protein [Candidatus Cryptobacteroides merdavium]